MFDPVAVQIGPISIHWYGVIMTTAFILGAALAYRGAAREGIDPDHVLNMLILIIPVAIICARLYYVVFSWEDYRYEPLEALAIWHGGLAIHGGLIGGFLAGYYYVKKQRLDFWKIGDIFAPSIILGQAIGRWGNFLNQEAFGGPVSKEFISRFPGFIQDQMYIGGQYHHPTFLYESMWNFLVFIFLLVIRKRVDVSGTVLLLYLGLYSAGRFVVEGMRTDSLMLGPIRVAQLVSLLLIGLSIAGILYRWKRTKPDLSRNKF
ncbi:MAG: prolipoprotein diacylglyceryl transferase [Eubacteriales bacterium]